MTPAPARETIFALSSGTPPAAIAIVRISGAAAGQALAALAGSLPEPRHATLRTLRADDGELIDRALVLWFPGPASATGEDCVELHLHGGRATVAAMLAALGGMPGLRMAEPGEFTRRAFDNGRIDLLQAEGLADLLAAETADQRRQALRLAEGGLGAMVDRWRQMALDIAARIEAAIEFGEEEEDVPADPAIAAAITALRDAVEHALEAPPAERLRDGARIVLAGPPNAGKSTLINALAGRAVALASDVPGTTRDLLEAPLVIVGHACILIDSAGLREGGDSIEQMGIKRARDAMAGADLLLWLGSPADRPVGPCITIAARCDIVSPDPSSDVAVSALTGAGMERLRDMMVGHLAALRPAPDAIALAERQRLILSDVARELDMAGAQTDPVLVAAHLIVVRGLFDQLTGRAGIEDMLDSLFGRFCIGK